MPFSLRRAAFAAKSSTLCAKLFNRPSKRFTPPTSRPPTKAPSANGLGDERKEGVFRRIIAWNGGMSEGWIARGEELEREREGAKVKVEMVSS